MSRRPMFLSEEPGRAQALVRLYMAIERATEAGESVPCMSGSDLWLSESRGEQEAAGWRCMACPVIADCREYVTNHPEPAGVWAGLSFADRRQNTRRTA